MTFIKYTYFILLIIVILIIYSLYFDHPKSIKINQTELQHFHFNLLYEKFPIVIQDTVHNINDINKLWFKHNFVKKNETNNLFDWMKCNSKYTIVLAKEDLEIHISNPYTEFIDNKPCSNANIISIALKTNQFIIVPHKWHFITEKQCDVFHINDIFTYIYDNLN